MIIDPIDLKLIRSLELHGSVPVQEIISKFQITKSEILLRIRNFEESGFLESYGMKLFLPGVTGGKWSWGCIACQATSRFKPEGSVPYLEEIVENLSFPSGVCPDISLLFYSQNLRETYKIINKTPGVTYAEIYKIGEYDIDVPRILLPEDWHLIAELYSSLHELRYSTIHTMIHEPHSDEEVKLSRLLWSKKNRKGVVSIFPNFDWSVIKNYSHLHCAVSTKLRTKELRKIVNVLGCSGNITSRFKKRYIQVEFDAWGFSDLQVILNTLKGISKLTVEGYSFARKNKIYHEWIKEYIQTQL